MIFPLRTRDLLDEWAGDFAEAIRQLSSLAGDLLQTRLALECSHVSVQHVVNASGQRGEAARLVGRQQVVEVVLVGVDVLVTDVATDATTAEGWHGREQEQKDEES